MARLLPGLPDDAVAAMTAHEDRVLRYVGAWLVAGLCALAMGLTAAVVCVWGR